MLEYFIIKQGGWQMTKYDYIENIMLFIASATGINFQIKVKEVLAVYYRENGKTYEMPDYYGGDQKNDGWVVEESIFYQIFAPTRLKESLKKEIQDKFKEDLTELLRLIFTESKWNGKINEFIFIVNTFDNNLPHDSLRFFETEVELLQKQYNCKFKFKVSNQDYIKDLLYGIDDEDILKEISSRLHILNTINYKGVTEGTIVDLIIHISNETTHKIMNIKTGSSYKRISTVKKIEINDLLLIKNEIEGIMSNLDVVEKAVALINQNILDEERFERVKSYIIDLYDELSKELHGIELYNEIINRCLLCTNGRWNFEAPVKFLIVYIFDKCDIFEKE